MIAVIHSHSAYASAGSSVQGRDKSSECLPACLCAFIDTGILQNIRKYMTDLILQDLHHIVFCDLLVFRKEFLHSVRMFRDRLFAADIFSFYNISCEQGKLFFQS